MVWIQASRIRLHCLYVSDSGCTVADDADVRESLVMRPRSQLIAWKVAGRVSDRHISADEVVRVTGWVFNNVTGDHLTLADFVATGDEEVPAYLEAFGLRYPENNQQTMIEIGSGIGRMTAAFTREFSVVIAADLDSGFLERCHETVSRYGRADHLRTLEVADGRSLALGDDCVDFAFSYLTFQHCARADALNLAQEAVRVTRSGGRIALNFRGPSRLDPLLLPLGIVVRNSFRLPRVGGWLSQRRSIARLAWQVSRISPSEVLATLGGSVDGVTIWSGGAVDDLQGAFRRGRFDGINHNHWWITATVS